MIAGHNYRSHFGPLSNLDTGDEVRFEDVNGRQFIYQVAETEVLQLYCNRGNDWWRLGFNTVHVYT